MPDAHESCRNAPSQPHKCSRFIVYTNPRKKVQALIDFSVGMFIGRVHEASLVSERVSAGTRGFFRSSGADSVILHTTHGLRPWAAFFRRFAAGAERPQKASIPREVIGSEIFGCSGCLILRSRFEIAIFWFVMSITARELTPFTQSISVRSARHVIAMHARKMFALTTGTNPAAERRKNAAHAARRG